MAKSFAQNLRYFLANFFLRTFALFLRMKRNEFCAIFLRNLHKTENIFCEMLRLKRNFSFAQFFCAICAKTASFTQNVTF